MSPTPIAQRVPACPKCRYSWRGLPPEGACPECGLRFNEMSKEFRPRRPVTWIALMVCAAIGGPLLLIYYFECVERGVPLSTMLLNESPHLFAMLVICSAAMIQVCFARRFGPCAVILPDGLWLRRGIFMCLLIPWRRFKSFIRPKYAGRRIVGYLDTSGGQQRIKGVFASNDAANEFVDRACAEVRRVHMMASDSNPTGDSQ